MKKIKVILRIDPTGSECEDIIEVEDDATEEQIEIAARHCAMSMITWEYEEITNN